LEDVVAPLVDTITRPGRAAASARPPRRLPWLALALGVALGPACGGGNVYAPPPPPEVTVAHPTLRDVTLYAEFTGHTVAVETTEIRARVQGNLQRVLFTPGSEVKQGDLLFVIEPTLYQAQVAQSKADVQGRQAQLGAAEEQLAITREIFRKAAGSRTDLVTKTQARDLAAAELERAKANLIAAELSLSYTHIYAPFTGLIDRNLVDVGNLVGSGEATKLATMVRYQPIYAYFTMSERDLLQYRDSQRGIGAAEEQQGGTAQLALATDSGFPHLGEVDYESNRVDPDTGTIELRAVFPNSERRIVPGMFARVRLPMSHGPAILVPESAVAADQGGPYLLTVNDANVVEYHRVRVGALIEGVEHVIEDGVAPEQRVIVNGLQRARPGAAVKPVAEGAEEKPAAGEKPKAEGAGR